MTNTDVTIEAVAYELAPHIITSSAIEQSISKTMERLKLPKGLLGMLTGIKERRFWEPGVKPSDVATIAAQKVIDKAGIDPKEIGCLINTSVSKDYIEPAVASLVHGNLKLSSRCTNFDISNACLGFMSAISTMILMIEARQIKYGLIVNGESSREVVESTLKILQGPDVTMEDYRENFASLTLGSGAVAMLLCHKDDSHTNHRINGIVNLSDTKRNRLCLGQREYMKSDAPGILNYGVLLAHRTWKLASRIFSNWSDDLIDLYIPHQVSTKNLQMLFKVLEITPEKHYLNFQNLGNIGPAAVPITLAMAEEEGRMNVNDHVALLGIGSGLNCSMISVTW